MSDAVTAAIEASIAAAGSGGESTEVGNGGGEQVVADDVVVEGVDGGGDALVAGDEHVDAGADKVETEVVTGADGKPVVKDEKVKEPDEIDKLLEAEGIKLTKDANGRENRLPHSRTKKIIGNALAKERTAHAAVLQERDTRFAAIEKELTGFKRADHLAQTNPDQYILALAAQMPDRYGKFVKGGTVEAPVVPGAKFDKPRPQPNVKLEDGSLTYDDKGLEALTEWIAEKSAADATTRVTAEFNKRLDPFEQSVKAQQYRAEQLPKVRAQMVEAEKLWGQPFKDDHAKGTDSEILKYMAAHPTVPFDAAVAAVLVPKIRAERNAIRGEVMNEMKRRPKAADRVPAAAAAAGANDSTPTSIEDVIRQSIRSLPGR